MNDRALQNQALQLAYQATVAFREGRYAEAAAVYERCIALQPRAPAFHFNLGTAREQLGDLAGAINAYLGAYRLNPKDGRLALFAGVALEAAGRRDEAVTMFTFGDDVDPELRKAKDDPRLDPEIRRRSAIADRAMREHFTRLHAQAIDVLERRSGTDLARVRRAIWPQTHDGPVQLSPYVDAGTTSPVWRELRGRLDWSSLHLFKASQETPFSRQFPRTLKALEAADVVRIDDRPMELYFFPG